MKLNTVFFTVLISDLNKDNQISRTNDRRMLFKSIASARGLKILWRPQGSKTTKPSFLLKDERNSDGKRARNTKVKGEKPEETERQECESADKKVKGGEKDTSFLGPGSSPG